MLQLRGACNETWSEGSLPLVLLWISFSNKLLICLRNLSFFVRVSPMSRSPGTYDRLVALAAAQHGFVRPRDLVQAGIRPAYLHQLLNAGRVEQRAQGLYRVLALPLGVNDELYEALLWADGDAVGAESALSLWALADVNPRRITVVVRPEHRVRRKGGAKVHVLYEALRPRDIDEIDGVPVVRPNVAIEQAIRNGVEHSLVEQALLNSRSRQLIAPLVEARLLIALDERSKLPRIGVSKD